MFDAPTPPLEESKDTTNAGRFSWLSGTELRASVAADFAWAATASAWARCVEDARLAAAAAAIASASSLSTFSRI